MARRVANPKVLETDNKELEELILICAKERTKENLARLIEAFEKSRFLLPVMLPKDMDPKLKERLQRGENVPKEEMPRLLPLVVKNPNGEHFVPAYTSKEHISDDRTHDAIMNTGSVPLMNAATHDQISGIILNPDTNKLILRPEFIQSVKKYHEMKKQNPNAGADAGRKEIRMSPAEFEVFARNNVEKGLMAKTAFADPKAFMERLEEEREEYICELYRQPFGKNIPNPYEAEKFSVMILNISETMTVASIDLPQPKAAGNAKAIYYVYDPTVNRIRYFLFERAEGTAGENLFEMTADGRHNLVARNEESRSELYFLLDHIGSL